MFRNTTMFLMILYFIPELKNGRNHPRRKCHILAEKNTSESRHVKAEINLALNLDKKITTVRLDSATFDMDLEMYLTNDHYLVVRENRIFDEEIIRAMDDTTRVSG